MISFSQAIDGFVFAKGADGYSPVTIRYYRENLERFERIIGDVDIGAITTDMLREAFAELRARKLRESSVQVYWKVMRSFFGWAEKELGAKRPDMPIQCPEYENEEIIPFTKKEVETILQHCRRSPRNKALILLLLDTGVRVSELARLTVGDLDMERGSLVVRPFMSGKKSKPRIVYIGKTTKKALWLYLAPRNADTSAPLVATLQGEPLTRLSIKNILTRLSKACGVPGIHAHKFRHTFALEYIKAGGDIFTLQELLGHNSLEMVRRYVHIADSHKQETHLKASPADKWLSK